MKVFSTFIAESNNSTFTLTADDFNTYKEVIEKTKRSKDFLHLLWLVSQYPALFDPKVLKEIINGRYVNEVPMDASKDIVKLAKKAGDEVKLLPQMLSAAQRDAVIQKKIDPNDLTLDLETPKGRDVIYKKYIPLINKLVKQYQDKSPLSKEELLSAAGEGITNAMNDYKNPEELEKIGKSGNMTFTSYAAYRIKQQILNDIEEYSHNVHISSYYREKEKEIENLGKDYSIDSMFATDADDKPMSIDRFFGLSSEDEQISQVEKQEIYDKIFKRIESKFSARDCMILYKIWGANGYKREKVKDIAKELGISSPAVVQAVSRIVKFVANDKYCKEIYKAYESLVDDYVCGKLFEVCKEDKKTILESFIYDDIYLLLESLNKFTNKEKFQKLVNKATDELAVDDALFIYRILQNKELLDRKNVKKYKDAIIRFLENVYPDQSFKDAKIDDIAAELNDLRTVSLKFAIAW